jgi:DNA-binding MarR family transcriptional regulator
MHRAAFAAAHRFDSAAQEAFLNLWRTFDRLQAIEQALFDRFGLTGQQYNALRLLRSEHPRPLPTLALAGRLVSRAPDITRLLAKLEARGLVARRRPVDDRRTVLVRITPRGQRLLARLAPLVRRCHEEQLGHLAPASLRRLVSLLRAARRPHEINRGGW